MTTNDANNVESLLKRAYTLHRAEKFDQAEPLYRQVLAQKPDHFYALNLLGLLELQLGRAEQGEQLVRQSLGIRRSTGALINLAGILREQRDRRTEAVALYREAIAQSPNNAEFHASLGTLLHEMGDHEQAITALRTSLESVPAQWRTQMILWSSMGESGRREEIEAEYLRLAERVPNEPGVHVNASALLQQYGKPEAAIRASRRAVAMRPGMADAHSSLANAMVAQGRIQEALEEYRQTLRIDSRAHAVHGNLLFALHYISDDPAQLWREHAAWGEQHAPVSSPGSSKPRVPRSTATRKLRVGYVSPDLRAHPVGRLVLPIVTAHDRSKFEVHCYSVYRYNDAITSALQSRCDGWHDVAMMSDDAIAAMIAAHGIDILVDLAGHTAHSRLLVFARKPAPVQVSYMGYPDTTGMRAIDYRITDAIADPPGPEAFCAEELVRLEGCFLCWSMPKDLPELIEPAGNPRAPRPFTFGCFNNIAKISPQTMDLWAEILKQADDARLLLRTKALDDPATVDRVRRDLSAHGVPIERVDLAGHEYGSSHLLRYNDVDLALDTFPYNGTATTWDALSMGVPVVTLAGRTHASRVGASMLTAAGLAAWVANRPEDYIRIAVSTATAGSSPSPAQRSEMRRQIADSPLCDHPTFMQRFEAALDEIAPKG